MPAGKTYVKIASQTLGSAVSSVTFSNIPQNYTDLFLATSVKWTGSGDSSFGIRFNSDSGSNYSITRLYGNSSGAGTDRSSNATSSRGGQLDATNFSANFAHIMNYSNSTTYKTLMWRSNISASTVFTGASLWRSTSAITSIDLGYFDAAGNWASGTTFTLYGIECAKSPYAEGGDKVYSTGTHWVHEFYYSGTFVPRQNLTADYLVVAGGGAGGHAGGGGAGGFRTLTSQSLTSQSYAVTVGAGGSRYIYNPNTPGSNGSDSTFNGLTSTGGGRGSTGTYAASNGGSGGGGNSTAYGGGFTTAGTSSPVTSPVQGYAGGGGGGGLGGGGGGGAGGAGSAQSGDTGGAGGVGASSSITGSSITYAGGGGGGGSGAGAGGSGGGGAGATGDNNATSGTANTGSGGGGSRVSSGSSNTGITGQGGSGIVIVRYAV